MQRRCDLREVAIASLDWCVGYIAHSQVTVALRDTGIFRGGLFLTDQYNGGLLANFSV